MKYSEWQPIYRIVSQFKQDLLGVVDRYFRARLISTSEWLDLYALQAAQRMVTGLAARNARTWRQAAAESMKGRLIYNALQAEMGTSVGARVNEIVAKNAQLIRTVPANLTASITQLIAKRQMEGMRASVIAEELKFKVPNMVRSQVELIARTEVSKTTTALTRARSESLDIPFYVWRTSRDQRVRLSHHKMEGVLVSWDDPASPEHLAGQYSTLGKYAPGDAPNCRCYPQPLLELNDVAWPHKVYHDERVQYMTRARFALLASQTGVLA